MRAVNSPLSSARKGVISRPLDDLQGRPPVRRILQKMLISFKEAGSQKS